MVQRKRFEGNEEGFTLFELLIAITILAVLAGIIVFAVGSSQANGVAASCTTDAKAFQTALEEYKTDTGAYPPLGKGDVLITTVVAAGASYGPFMRQLPGSTQYQIRTDGSGGVFVYPQGTLPNGTAHGMQTQTVGGAWSSSVNNANTQMLLDFSATSGAICSNPYLNQAPT